ncbi:MAG: glycosyltransferase family 39 protein [Bacteroidia bacterium]|nr:glycosyltransferase family 39 protein [Bacteroidia bacterium]MDW8158296.1 glycosyltransferase family 39 protein [Bacteroidia bacterium]
MQTFLLGYFQKSKELFKRKPLPFILIIAFLVRLIAVIFSKGFAFHDDHFLVIEIAQSWIEGVNYWINQERSPTHSLVYPGLHYFLFLGLEGISIRDPQAKMYLVRFLHALHSLWIVYFGYHITARLSNIAIAQKVGLLLALLWFFPILACRNLIEMVCIPFLMAGIYWLTRPKVQNHDFFIAGFLIGLGFIFRYQSAVFILGLGLYLLYQKELKVLLFLGLGYLTPILLIQGTVDLIFWGYPFASLHTYIEYNITHVGDYPVNNVATFSLLLLGIGIPPISLYLFRGYAKALQTFPIYTLPALAFFTFHSLYPNRQERFILPAVPFWIIFGTIGWHLLQSKPFQKFKASSFYKKSWIFFWVVNTILLLAITPTYTKKTRIEPLEYLANQPDFSAIILDGYDQNPPQLAYYYLQKWNAQVIQMDKTKSKEEFLQLLGSAHPTYLILFEEKEIAKREDFYRNFFPKLKLEKSFSPSWLDSLFHYLNPINKNQKARVYKLV